VELTFGRRAGLIGLAILGVLAVLGAAGALPSRSATSANQQFPCGIVSGPTWHAGSLSGNTWYVASITDRSECAKSAKWANLLGPKIVSGTGAPIQAYKFGGYGCVLTRAQLSEVCYVGNGGQGAIGVLVAGDPTHNPLVPASIRANPPRTGTPTTPAPAPLDLTDPALGVPGPWPNGARCGHGGVDSYTGPTWEFSLPDGQKMRGSTWVVQSFTFFTDATCSAIRPLLPALTGSVAKNHGPGYSTQDSWGCVAASAGNNSVLPLAGCARVVFPRGATNSDGSPSLTPALEQVVVYPDISHGAGVVSVADQTTLLAPSHAEASALAERMSAVEYDVRNFGVTFVALNWITAQEHQDAADHNTRGSPMTWPITRACGGSPSGYWPTSAVPSAQWTSHSAHGNTWTLAAAGGYDCKVAEPMFKVFLANLAASPNTPSLSSPAALHNYAFGGPLQRYGWDCNPDQTALIVICKFSPSPISADHLQTGLGRGVPTSFRVGIAAATPGTTIDRIRTAIEATILTLHR
jgi:hypothetical protein